MGTRKRLGKETIEKESCNVFLLETGAVCCLLLIAGNIILNVRQDAKISETASGRRGLAFQNPEKVEKRIVRRTKQSSRNEAGMRIVHSEDKK